jgi:predicted transcriptional regulator
MSGQSGSEPGAPSRRGGTLQLEMRDHHDARNPDSAYNAHRAPTGGTAAGYAQLFRDWYPRYQYHFVEFLTEHLADCSRTFGGDLQMVAVLATIGQMCPFANRNRGKAPTEPVRQACPISASRIADVTGIPRETVRRKLKTLETRGWIEPAGAGWQLKFAGEDPVVRADLRDFDSRAIDRVARFFSALAALGSPARSRR